MIESTIFGDKDVSRETLDRLRIFEALVKKWTKAINLVSKSDLEEEGVTDLQVGEFFLYIPGSTTIKTSDRVAKGNEYFDVIGIEELKDRFGSVPIKKLTLRKSF